MSCCTQSLLSGAYLQILDSVQKLLGFWNFLTVDSAEARILFPKELWQHPDEDPHLALAEAGHQVPEHVHVPPRVTVLCLHRHGLELSAQVLNVETMNKWGDGSCDPLPGACLRRPCWTWWCSLTTESVSEMIQCFLSCAPVMGPVPTAVSAAWLTQSHPRRQLASHQHTDTGWERTNRFHIQNSKNMRTFLL